MTTREFLFNSLGLALFFASGLCYMVPAVCEEDPWAIAGTGLWLIGCLCFVMPLWFGLLKR